ncbi:MAG: hypothetical protein ABW215_08795, partial [Kibdelosporangium sp.]
MTTPSSHADELADELMRLGFESDPIGASLYGIPGYEAKVGDPSAAAEQELRAKALELGRQAEAVDRAGVAAKDVGAKDVGAKDVAAKDAVTLGVVAQQARSMADRIDSHMPEYTITDLFVGPAAGLLTLLPMTSL